MTRINNYDTWLALLQLVNVQQNGQIPPSVFNKWYNEANRQLFMELAKQFQTNQVGADLLSPFLSIKLVPITPQMGQNWGLAAYPADYEYFVNAMVLTQQQEDECFSDSNLPNIDQDGKSKRYTDPDLAKMAQNYAGANIVEQQLQLIDAQRWSACLTHKTKGPTLTNPKMTQFNSGFKVAPKGGVSILLQYFHTPAESVFSGTVSTDDIFIYNPLASTQLEWSSQVLPKFLAILQKKYAAYIGDEKMYQMGENEHRNT